MVGFAEEGHEVLSCLVSRWASDLSAEIGAENELAGNDDVAQISKLF